MPKQIDINDLLPSEIKDDTRRFIDTQYQGRVALDELPPVRATATKATACWPRALWA